MMASLAEHVKIVKHDLLIAEESFLEQKLLMSSKKGTSPWLMLPSSATKTLVVPRR